MHQHMYINPKHNIHPGVHPHQYSIQRQNDNLSAGHTDL